MALQHVASTAQPGMRLSMYTDMEALLCSQLEQQPGDAALAAPFLWAAGGAGGYPVPTVCNPAGPNPRPTS